MVNKVPSGVPHKFYLSRLIGIYVLFVALRPAPCAMLCPVGTHLETEKSFLVSFTEDDMLHLLQRSLSILWPNVIGRE
jgi:hypothetical protein